MDGAMAHYAAVLKRDFGKDVSRIRGSAAAGGLGAGLLAFLKAKLVPGRDGSCLAGCEKAHGARIWF